MKTFQSKKNRLKTYKKHYYLLTKKSKKPIKNTIKKPIIKPIKKTIKKSIK